LPIVLHLSAKQGYVFCDLAWPVVHTFLLLLLRPAMLSPSADFIIAKEVKLGHYKDPTKQPVALIRCATQVSGKRQIRHGADQNDAGMTHGIGWMGRALMKT
jgi:hypothetical protein